MAKQDYSLTAYMFGVVGLVLAFFQPLAGLVLSVIGLVQSKKEKGELAMKAKKYSTIALVISILMLILSVVVAYLSSTGYLSGLGY